MNSSSQLHQHHDYQKLPKLPSNMNGMSNNDNISEKLGLQPGVRKLKLGPTFLNDKSSTAFHTIKYDFKPASVDTSKMATVDVGDNNMMTVTVPHLDGAGVPQTVFKGSQRPYTKECVLIIDKTTGEITLERLSCNIQVKKTRSELKTQSILSFNSNTGIRPITPIDAKKSPTDGKTKSRSKFTSGKKKEPSNQLRQKPNLLCPSYHGKSPPMKSPSGNCNNNSNNSINFSAMPSSSQLTPRLPICENDNLTLPTVTPSACLSSTTTSHLTAPPRTRFPAVNEKLVTQTHTLTSEVGILSESSSSDSSSDSSDSELDSEKSSITNVNGHTSNGARTSPPVSIMPDVLLNEDLQLSESESDSD